MGDVNARIGDLQNDFEIEFSNTRINTCRQSKDKEVNARGRMLIELLSDLGAVILNGRTKEDEVGEFTYLSRRGASVIDIAAVSLDITGAVRDFKVECKTFSDHMPVVTEICIQGGVSNENSLTLLPKLSWTLQDASVFRQKLESEITNRENNNSAIELNTDHLSSMIMQASRIKAGGRQPKFKNKWFDSECFGQRKISFRWLAIFRKTGSDFAKSRYLEENVKYKSICRHKKEEYFEDLVGRLGHIKDSRQWWAVSKEIQGKSCNIGSKININVLYDHFKDLLAFDLVDNFEYPPQQLQVVHELDSPITEVEVAEVLHNSKDNKAPGEDRIPYEFLKNSGCVFIDRLTKAFNNIFSTGEVPDSFKKAIIFPLYKKGDPNVVSNYRGLSFINTVAKCFVSILVNRLQKWESQYAILHECQAGFRKGYSTVDNVFNLVNAIHLAWNSGKKKIYCCFVDFKAAFDTISRNKMSYKLYIVGLSSKLIRVFGNLYNGTKSAVWDGNSLSEYFSTHIGLRQGCPSSPILFSLYLNDLFDEIGGGFTVEGIHLRMLLYADDLVLLADKPEVLQQMLTCLESYCDRWSLRVNIAKTKLVIFRKGGRLAMSERWSWKGEDLEVVNAYKYLGVVLTPKLNFKKHLNEKLSAAKFSLNATWNKFVQHSGITLSAKFQIFNAVTRAIMCYCCQVWGFMQFEEVEKLLRYFLKKALKLPRTTPNYMLNLEFNTPDLFLYTFRLHCGFIAGVFERMQDGRLPKLLAKEMWDKNIWWAERYRELADKHDINIGNGISSVILGQILEKEAEFIWRCKVFKARQSIRHDLYGDLSYDLGTNTYLQDSSTLQKMRLIFKCRGGLLALNASPFRGSGSPLCSLCNMEEEENLKHFVAVCPILSEFRVPIFGKTELSENEVLEYLNGRDWEKLYRYVDLALKYRDILVAEYNM